MPLASLRGFLSRLLNIAARPPVLLLSAGVLAYGIHIPWLGLYADDWPFAYVNHIAGFGGVVEFISWVRPVAAWIFAAATALTGEQFWVAHVLLLLLHWGAGVLFWRLLRRAWPAHPQMALWAALLFVIFPAFKQSPLALEYTPHFTALCLLFASLELSLRLAEDPPPAGRARWMAALAWLGGLQVFILEYFVGLEILRPLLVWVALSRRMPRRRAAREALRRWLPYLPLLGGFLLWRVFVVGFPSYQPELVSGLGASPLAALRELAQTVLRDLFTAGAAAWAQPFLTLPAGRRALLAWAGITAAALGWWALTLAWSARHQPPPADPPAAPAAETSAGRAWPAWLEYALLGMLAMLAAGWPFWITRLPLSLVFPYDRTSLAFMTGSCMLTAGALGWIEQVSRRVSLPGVREGEQQKKTLKVSLPGNREGLPDDLARPGEGLPRKPLGIDSPRSLLPLIAPLLLALMLAFSTGLHFQNANAFRKEWSLLTNFTWQLAWRAPGIATGTVIVLDQPPFNYHVDKFISPLVSWMYHPESRSLQTPYALLDFHKLWGKTLPPENSSAAGGDPIQTSYGTLRFEGDTAHMMVVVYAPPGCLRVLTPAESSALLISGELKSTLPLSSTAWIETDPPTPARPPAFIGPEPPRGWCYAFEQAELALQRGDPGEAARLGDEAFAAGLAPQQPSEYLPFVYAYAQLGRWEDALRRSKEAAANDFYLRAACAAWERIGEEIDAEQAEDARGELGCR